MTGMLAYLHQYQHEQADFDDNRTTGESQTEDTVDKDSEEYFGANIESFGVETWDTVEYDGDPVQRRSISIGDVTAVSARQESDADPGLPGQQVQVRMAGGEETFIEQAVIIEVQDEEPQ
jgi:hypothetical protein